MKERVAVIGAGVSGLTCGILFAERGHPTTIFAEESGEQTTSADAGAIWFPYDAEPAEAVIAWSRTSFERLREISANQRSAGVRMIELRCFARAGELPIPDWATAMGARRLTRAELLPAFVSGFALEVPQIDTTKYLPYLASRFADAGGMASIGTHFDDLSSAPFRRITAAVDLVINCAGIGAVTLVPDPQLEPNRGQVAIVPAIALDFAIVCDDPPLMYALPHTDSCVLGGTNTVSADRGASATDTAQILSEGARVLQIPRPEVLAERVGLRPYRRAGVCLEEDQSRRHPRLIHNYGHGGAGFTLSWGCAARVLELAVGKRDGGPEA